MTSGYLPGFYGKPSLPYAVVMRLEVHKVGNIILTTASLGLLVVVEVGASEHQHFLWANHEVSEWGECLPKVLCQRISRFGHLCSQCFTVCGSSMHFRFVETVAGSTNACVLRRWCLSIYLLRENSNRLSPNNIQEKYGVKAKINCQAVKALL